MSEELIYLSDHNELCVDIGEGWLGINNFILTAGSGDSCSDRYLNIAGTDSWYGYTLLGSDYVLVELQSQSLNCSEWEAQVRINNKSEPYTSILVTEALAIRKNQMLFIPENSNVQFFIKGSTWAPLITAIFRRYWRKPCSVSPVV